LAAAFKIVNISSPVSQRDCPPLAVYFDHFSLITRQMKRESNNSHEVSSGLLVSSENNGAMMSKWLTTSGLDAESKNISCFVSSIACDEKNFHYAVGFLIEQQIICPANGC
jgi:hypothetical protein